MIRRGVCAILLALTPALAHGQQPVVSQSLDSATVVRLRLSDGTRFTAQLLAPFGPESSSVVYAPPRYRDCGVPRAHCRLQLGTSELRAIEVQRGSNMWRSALVGGAVGAGLGLVMGWAYSGPICTTGVPGSCPGTSHGTVVAISTALGAAFGTVVGALFGLGSPRWGPAP